MILVVSFQNMFIILILSKKLINKFFYENLLINFLDKIKIDIKLYLHIICGKSITIIKIKYQT